MNALQRLTDLLYAMTALAAPADVKDDVMLQIRPLLEMSKPELQKVWKEMDCSDFEPVAKLDLLAALLCRLLHDASDFDDAQSQPSSSTLHVYITHYVTNTCQELQGSCCFSRQIFWLQQLRKTTGSSRALAQGTQA